MINKANFRSFIHPILFSVFPILFLYSKNIAEVQAWELFLPLLFSSITAVLSISIFLILKRPAEISAAAVSYIIIVFFSFGHLKEVIPPTKMGFIQQNFLIFYIISALILLFCIFFILSRYVKNIRAVEDVLNRIALVLIILPLAVIIHFRATADSDRQMHKSIQSEKSIKSSEEYPDIYYIILDGYAASKTLKSTYFYDNSTFTNFLETNGFHVLDKSFSNYAHTYLSLASSLNMKYLDHKKKYSSRGKFQRDMYNLIENNSVVETLKNKGYRYIHISAGIGNTGVSNRADITIDPGTLNEFAIILLRTTLLSPLLKETVLIQQARNRIINTFEVIPQFAEESGPNFIFAHIMSPHPPYLFNIDGGIPERVADFKFQGSVWDRKEDYIKQLIYINSLVKDLVVTIKNKSSKDPVIILQADHGSGAVNQISQGNDLTRLNKEKLNQRFNILHAWYLPYEIKRPGDKMSPVNSFRFLFNTLFNYNLKLYNDEAWFSTSGKPYHFKKITGLINEQ